MAENIDLGLEGELEHLQVKLEKMRRQSEMLSLQNEITLLERQLEHMTEVESKSCPQLHTFETPKPKFVSSETQTPADGFMQEKVLTSTPYRSKTIDLPSPIIRSRYTETVIAEPCSTPVQTQSSQTSLDIVPDLAESKQTVIQ